MVKPSVLPGVNPRAPLGPWIASLRRILYGGWRVQRGSRALSFGLTLGLRNLGLDVARRIVPFHWSLHLGLIPIGHECPTGRGTCGS
jgi:hypothetical protein